MHLKCGDQIFKGDKQDVTERRRLLTTLFFFSPRDIKRMSEQGIWFFLRESKIALVALLIYLSI
jgi:hypothetical protein